MAVIDTFDNALPELLHVYTDIIKAKLVAVP